MKKDWLIWIAVILGLTYIGNAYADILQWDTPVGNFNLNLTTTEALIGYDAILKQTIGGASLPVYQDPKGIVTLQIGAVGAWPTNAAGVEPYIAAGHDILREIPYLSQFNSCHLNIFGRYATPQGKAGAGVSFSYAFAMPSTTTAPPAPTPAP
jgi:hypothetical protein